MIKLRVVTIIALMAVSCMASAQETMKKGDKAWTELESTLRDAVYSDYRCVLLSDCMAEPIGSQFSRGNHEASLFVIETLFGLPGVGRLTVTAINQRNYVVVQGAVLVIATLFIVVNLVTDLLYGWLDPRIGEGAER